MTQHADIFLSTRHYSRNDYTALRSFCLNVPFATIARLYYTDDSPQVVYGLEKYLLEMRDDLMDRAIGHNPLLAKSLQFARRSGQLSAVALKILRDAADIPALLPDVSQPLTLWFKPKTTLALQQEGVATVGELMALIERRGSGWWRAIPRIGFLRAQAVVRWLRGHAGTLGALVLDEHAVIPASATPSAELVFLSPQQPALLAPLGHFTTSADYDGSQGVNRARLFCFIQARNDLEAVTFFLSRFDQPHTLRAYRRELERFLLWAIVVRGKPLSSLLVDDCEAYKTFLASPCPAFTGMKAPRFSCRWKPFSEKPMRARSQRQAMIILRSAFDYLVGVRYLSGNPWIAVKDPSVTKEIHIMQIHKALPLPLWDKVTALIKTKATGSDLTAAQYRIAFAACLLMGDSGLRREEAATVKRCDLIKSPFARQVFELYVTGKGNRRRVVPISLRTIEALRCHWQDRGLDWDSAPDSLQPLPLLAPLIIPRHASARVRHEQSGMGYSANNLSRLLKTTLTALLDDPAGGLDEEERRQLFSTTAHHLRHTFGTLSVAGGLPVDVAQSVLGHASASTTAIYVQAKRQRIMEEAARFYSTEATSDDVA